MKKIILSIFLCLCALSLYAQNQAGAAWFVPDSLTLNAGELLNLEIHVNTGTRQCRAFGFDLSYHAGALDYVGYKVVSNLPVTYVEEWASTGQVSIASMFASGMAEGPSSDLHLVTLVFKAVGALNVTINLGINNLLESTGTPIGTLQGDSIRVVINGSMTPAPTVGATQVPTPTPLSGETPAPTPAGDFQWSKGFRVHDAVASGNPPVQYALVEASALTRNASYTDSNGECSLQVWAHDTASVSVNVSAEGYASAEESFSPLDGISVYDVLLQPYGSVTTEPTLPPSPPPPAYSLHVARSGGSSSVTITADPPGSTNIYPISVGYDSPTTVTLTAHGYTYPDGAIDLFYSWEGDLSGSDNPATIVVDGQKSVTAVYVHGDPTPTHPPEPTAEPECSCMKGDVNCSGSVDIVDALLVAQYYVGLEPVNFTACASDVDCNGSIQIVDALIIAQYYVGIITELPC
jgi:hypothetical protein